MTPKRAFCSLSCSYLLSNHWSWETIKPILGHPCVQGRGLEGWPASPQGRPLSCHAQGLSHPQLTQHFPTQQPWLGPRPPSPSLRSETSQESPRATVYHRLQGIPKMATPTSPG